MRPVSAADSTGSSFANMITSNSIANKVRPGRGFTLVELMIVVAIVAILAAVAYPSYLQHIRKSRRADAKAALLDLASRQERFFSIKNTYADTPDKLGYSGTAYPIDVLTGSQAYYRLSVTLPTTVKFTATATPSGNQASDPCGTYSITELGVQDNSSNSTPTASCW